MTNNNMIFIANWKMNGNFSDISKAKILNKLIKQRKFKRNKVVYCPPYTLIKSFSDNFKKTNISVGAQNCHHQSEYGAKTGSINCKLIKSSGAKYVIIGHSESRIEGETDNLLNKKIQSAIKENLNIIFCIGETLNQKKKKQTSKILKNQLFNGLRNIKNFKNISIAYEPVWAIGTGIVPKKSELERNMKLIKTYLKKLKRNNSIKVLYGGSVKPDNASELSKIKEIEGFLIGGASLNAKKFVDIIKKSSI